LLQPLRASKPETTTAGFVPSALNILVYRTLLEAFHDRQDATA
jgi:hypothetical protein